VQNEKMAYLCGGDNCLNLAGGLQSASTANPGSNRVSANLIPGTGSDIEFQPNN
jgi:hypothetical protein